LATSSIHSFEKIIACNLTISKLPFKEYLIFY
jgi:hypothetical protein